MNWEDKNLVSINLFRSKEKLKKDFRRTLNFVDKFHKLKIVDNKRFTVNFRYNVFKSNEFIFIIRCADHIQNQELTINRLLRYPLVHSIFIYSIEHKECWSSFDRFDTDTFLYNYCEFKGNIITPFNSPKRKDADIEYI